MYKKENTVFHNKDIISGFNEDEKAALFDDIVEMYFMKNFGTVSKSDFETYLFSFYLEHLLDKDIPFDDYTLGRDLGLTQSRIRALKERKELKYPRNGYRWQEEFLKYAKHARYDESTRLVKFLIPDVNVIKDVRNFFEFHYQYDEYQLNPKLFQCRPESFIEMGKMIAEEQEEKFELTIASPDELKKIISKGTTSIIEKNALKKILSGAVEDGIKDLLINGTKEIILFVLGNIVPGTGVLKNVFDILRDAISR